MPFFGIFLDGRGFDSRAIGEILAIATATKIFGPAIWANLADKTGKQLSIIQSGGLLALLCFIALIWAQSFWAVAFCLALNSLFWTAILPQLEVLTLASVKHSAKIYSRIRLWGSIGFMALAILGGEVIAKTSTEAFVWLSILITLLMWASTFLLRQVNSQRQSANVSGSMLARLLMPACLLFFIAGLMLQVSFGPYYAFFALYLKNMDYSGMMIGIFISIGVVAEILIFIYAGKIFKYLSIKSALVLSLLATVVRWYMQGYMADVLPVLIVSQVLHAFSFGLYHCASIQFIQRHFASNQQSRGQAVYIGGVYGLGGALGAYIAGILWQDGAGVSQTFNFAIAAAAIGLLLVLFMSDPKKRPLTSGLKS